MVVVADISQGSGAQGGHLYSLDDTRDEVFRQLQRELLSVPDFQQILIGIGTSPDVDAANAGKRWKSRQIGGKTVVRHHTRTRRAARLWLLATALQGVLTAAELDYYAEIIETRRKQRIEPSGDRPRFMWPVGEPPASMPGSVLPAGTTRSDRVPRSNTIRYVAELLAVRAEQALYGTREDRGQSDRNRLSQVFGFLGLPPGDARPSLTSEAAGRRRRRDAPQRRQRVELERTALDRRVATGELKRVSEFIYVSVC